MDSDFQFVGPTYREVNYFRLSNSPVYLYSFDYLAPGAYPTLDPRLRDTAIPHGWELQYIYYQLGRWHPTSDDTDTTNYCVTFWTNFIKFG